jgi:hypothetical protein
MRRDGRRLDHRTLEAIRMMAVERVRDGERASSVVASFGFHRTTIAAIKRLPRLVRSFFNAPSVAYITDW